ncbi:MAG: hypothetical protein QOG60_1715, partial [Frankiaceae bacterium]|nr:hypothetical protein [Frankiaceae bacterium]
DENDGYADDRTSATPADRPTIVSGPRD